MWCHPVWPRTGVWPGCVSDLRRDRGARNTAGCKEAVRTAGATLRHRAGPPRPLLVASLNGTRPWRGAEPSARGSS